MQIISLAIGAWFRSSKSNVNDKEFEHNFLIVCRYMNVVKNQPEIDHLLISTFHSKMYSPLRKGVKSGPLSWKVQ
jgi:hypothetical protein